MEKEKDKFLKLEHTEIIKQFTEETYVAKEKIGDGLDVDQNGLLSAVNIAISTTPPTDPNVKIWINPNGKDAVLPKTAYDIAVENGFQGTEAEWLESLKADASDLVDNLRNETVSLNPQTFTDEQKAQIRDNIGAASSVQGTKADNAVAYTAQTLTDAQKAQARANIGAGTSNFDGNYENLSNKPIIPTLPAPTAFTIAVENWTDSDNADYPYKADITIEGVTAADIPNVYYSGDTEAAQLGAEIWEKPETIAGAVRVCAKNVPTEALSGYIVITKGGG